MVFLKKEIMLCQQTADWIPTGGSQSGGDTRRSRGAGGRGLRRREKTNVCILSFDTSGGYDPGLLLVLVEDVRISVDIAVDDLEPGLVGDAVSVSKCGRAGIWVARHDMERGTDEGGDGAEGVGRSG
jgi:hypothetical protein